MTEERMCVVCGVRPANSLMTRRLQKEGVGLYCSGDCARAASKNFKRRMNGDTVAKLVLTLKNLTEQYSGTVSGSQWLNAFREQYKSQRAFERTVALTSGIRAIANRQNIEINENSTKSWTFKYLGGNTISEWLKPSMRAKFDEIRREVGGTAAEGLETSETSEMSEVSAAETKLSKTSCCCGATEDKPCACMMAPEPMKCSAVEPMCPCYAALADSKSAETFEAETMTKAQAKKRFLALMKPYWLKDLKESRGPKLSRKQYIAKYGDDEYYDANMEDWEWWNYHVKTVETGKYAMASTSGDTLLRESLPFSYYAFINLLPIEWKGHEKYDEEPYDTDEYLLNDDWCIYNREIPWSEWSAADKRKYNKLNSIDMDFLEYAEQRGAIEDKYNKTVHHKSEAAKMKCKHCGPYYSNMNNMNNWDILSVVENPDFYEYWDYPASLKKQVKALIPALKGVKATKPKKAPAKPAAKAKPKAKAKSGRKGPDISATKRKIGTRMRGNDGNMWEVKPAGKSQRWVRGAETFEASRGGRGHQLMTKELSAKIPELYSQEEVEDPIVVAHYFSPYARQADWFVIEWDGQDLMFGLADLGYPELGYWTLSELESARRGSLPLVERDLHWTPVPLSEVRKTRMSAEGESPSRDNDRVAVGDRVRSYDFVLPNGELIRDDCYVEGRVTKIDSWEWCGPNCDHFFIVVEKMMSRGKEVAIPPGMDMCYPAVNESFVQIVSRKESESWKTCAMCGEPASFTVEDTPVGPRNFCCERCYAQYMGLPVEEPGYYGLEAEWENAIDWDSQCPKCGETAYPVRSKEYEGFVRTFYYCDCDKKKIGQRDLDFERKFINNYIASSPRQFGRIDPNQVLYGETTVSVYCLDPDHEGSSFIGYDCAEITQLENWMSQTYGKLIRFSRPDPELCVGPDDVWLDVWSKPGENPRYPDGDAGDSTCSKCVEKRLLEGLGPFIRETDWREGRWDKVVEPSSVSKAEGISGSGGPKHSNLYPIQEEMTPSSLPSGRKRVKMEDCERCGQPEFEDELVEDTYCRKCARELLGIKPSCMFCDETSATITNQYGTMCGSCASTLAEVINKHFSKPKPKPFRTKRPDGSWVNVSRQGAGELWIDSWEDWETRKIPRPINPRVRRKAQRAEDWNWGGDPDGPLAEALRRAKNSPKKTKPLELVRLPKSDDEVKEAETWDGPFGIETRTATGKFKKWEKVETYEKLIEKLTEMFSQEGFAPYALDVYAERMPRVQMTRAGPVVSNDRKVLLATYKYGKWESGPWMAYMPKPGRL